MGATNFFGKDVAPSHDRDHGRSDPALLRLTVGTLGDLAKGGDILEFAIGTDRIALPSHARGHRVAGIKLSPEMDAELRKKPGGDFSDCRSARTVAP